MAAEYQAPDWRVVDYQLFELDPDLRDVFDGPPLGLRGPGPPPLDPGGYFVCLGAAQSFGRFCARPFATLLSERLGLPVLNISRGAAGPSFFGGLGPVLDRYLAGARLVVVQVMSARSEGNSLFATDGLSCLRDRRSGEYLDCDEAYASLLRHRPPHKVARIVAETRATWCASYRRLLARIRAPKILLWFSTRRPAYEARLDTVSHLFGGYPQLVDAESVRAIRPAADAYVEVVGRRGLPQPLVDRFDHAPATVTDPWTRAAWTENWYYPSPAMHEAAAKELEPVCRRLLTAGGTDSGRSVQRSGLRRWIDRLRARERSSGSRSR